MSATSIIGTSTVIRHVQHLVTRVAEVDSPVLVTGEPGTGKELVARSIHEKSPRNGQIFIPVKCSAMSEDMLEAELFGHKANAFAGAHQDRPGRFELANGGTLFLDDIDKISPKIQARLMRFLQEGVIEPLGSQTPLPVNVRIIAASVAGIDGAVRERLFREDLYYRFTACTIYIPPVTERREDLPLLVNHFIAKFNRDKNKRITQVAPEAMSALVQYSWPNNVREIENLIERIVTLKSAGSIEINDLPPRLRNIVTDNIDNFYEKSLKNSISKPSYTNSNDINNHKQPTLGNNSGQQFQRNAQNTNNAMPSSSSRNNGGFLSSPYQDDNSKFSENVQYNRNFNNTLPRNPYPTAPAQRNAFDDAAEIDQFIKKEIDLGVGIDFYRVVEEFENRLIAEALRRTNHNKNRAAQLLSMNRTTLVEKLKKRAASGPVKVESGRVKRNSAFTIFDGLGAENHKFDGLDFLPLNSGDDSLDYE